MGGAAPAAMRSYAHVCGSIIVRREEGERKRRREGSEWEGGGDGKRGEEGRVWKVYMRGKI